MINATITYNVSAKEIGILTKVTEIDVLPIENAPLKIDYIPLPLGHFKVLFFGNVSIVNESEFYAASLKTQFHLMP